MPRVSNAVILAAGLGSRMLPATKAVPKEMLPIVDKPLIQYAVEEAVAGGIEEIIFVIAEGKEAIRDHFGTGTRADAYARASGDPALAGHHNRFRRSDDTTLVALFIDEADFRDPDALVDTRLGRCWFRWSF